MLVTEACTAIVDLCHLFGNSFANTALEIYIGIIEKAASGVSVQPSACGDSWTISGVITECCIRMVSYVKMDRLIPSLIRYLKHLRFYLGRALIL